MKIFFLILLFLSLNANEFSNKNFVDNNEIALTTSKNNLILIVKTELHTEGRNQIIQLMNKIELTDDITRIYIEDSKTTFSNEYLNNAIIFFDKSKKIIINAIFSNFSYNNINNMIKYELKLQEF